MCQAEGAASTKAWEWGHGAKGQIGENKVKKAGRGQITKGLKYPIVEPWPMTLKLYWVGGLSRELAEYINFWGLLICFSCFEVGFKNLYDKLASWTILMLIPLGKYCCFAHGSGKYIVTSPFGDFRQTKPTQYGRWTEEERLHVGWPISVLLWCFTLGIPNAGTVAAGGSNSDNVVEKSFRGRMGRI